MDTRTLFKLYSFPFLIVLLGICLYAGIMIFAKEQDLFSTKTSLGKSESIVQATQDEPATRASAELDSIKVAQIQPSPSVIEQEAMLELKPQEPSAPEPAKELDSIDDKNQKTEPTHLYAKYRANIRQAPNAQARIISRANIGETLEVLEDKEEWVKVRNRFGVEGYVASYLLEEQLEQSGGELYRVIPSSLNVRLKPSAQGVIIGQLSQNARIAIVKFNDEWAKVKLPNGQLGYISTQHILKIN